MAFKHQRIVILMLVAKSVLGAKINLVTSLCFGIFYHGSQKTTVMHREIRNIKHRTRLFTFYYLYYGIPGWRHIGLKYTSGDFFCRPHLSRQGRALCSNIGTKKKLAD
jgi:hypothetical protein